MENNFQNKNVNDKTAVSGQTPNKASEVKGELTYDDKVIQKSLAQRLNKLMGY